MAWRRSPAGVLERGMRALGFPGNLGDPVVSAEEPTGNLGSRSTNTP